MRTIPAAAAGFLLALSAGAARADFFQVYDGTRYVQYATVTIQGRPVGYTDAYGRIKFDGRPGRYVGEVNVHGASRTIEFKIDGSRQLKRVSVQ